MNRAFIIILAFAALLLGGCGGAQSKNFSGIWNSPQTGLFRLQQKENSVTGSYEYEDGRIRGTVVGNKLTFTWWQNVPDGGAYEAATPKERGNGYFILSASANSFQGKWRFDGKQEWNDTWYATRTTGP